jgi:hypothetical protein
MIPDEWTPNDRGERLPAGGDDGTEAREVSAWHLLHSSAAAVGRPPRREGGVMERTMDVMIDAVRYIPNVAHDRAP